MALRNVGATEREASLGTLLFKKHSERRQVAMDSTTELRKATTSLVRGAEAAREHLSEGLTAVGEDLAKAEAILEALSNKQADEAGR